MRDHDKPAVVEPCRRLAEHGLRAGRDARHGRRACARPGLAVETVNKVLEGRPHIVDRMLSGEVQLIFNTTEGGAGDRRQLQPAPHRADQQHSLLHDRRRARGRRSQAIAALQTGSLEVASLQSYFEGSF